MHALLAVCWPLVAGCTRRSFLAVESRREPVLTEDPESVRDRVQSSSDRSVESEAPSADALGNAAMAQMVRAFGADGPGGTVPAGMGQQLQPGGNAAMARLLGGAPADGAVNGSPGGSGAPESSGLLGGPVSGNAGAVGASGGGGAGESGGGPGGAGGERVVGGGAGSGPGSGGGAGGAPSGGAGASAAQANGGGGASGSGGVGAAGPGATASGGGASGGGRFGGAPVKAPTADDGGPGAAGPVAGPLAVGAAGPVGGEELGPEAAAFFAGLGSLRQDVIAHAQAREQRLFTETEAQKQRFRIAADHEAIAVETAYNRAAQGVRDQAAATIAEINAALQSESDSVRASADAELLRLDGVVDGKKAALVRTGDGRALQATQLGTEQSGRVTNGTAERVRKVGALADEKIAKYRNGHNGSDIVAVVSEARAAVAGELLRTGSGAASAIQGKANELGEKFKQDAADAAQEFDKPRRDARAHIIDARDKALAAMRDAANGATGRLQQEADKLAGSLDAEGARQANEIRAKIPDAEAAYAEAAAAAQGQHAQFVGGMLSDIDALAEEMREAAWYRPVAEAAIADLASAVAAREAELDTLITDAGSTMGTSTADAETALSEQAREAGTAAEQALADFTTGAGRISAEVGLKMGEAGTAGYDAMKAVTDGISAELDKTVSEVDTKFQKTLSERGTDLSKEADEALRGLDDVVEAYHKDTTEKADDLAEDSWLGNLVNAVSGFVEGIFEGAWELVKGIWNAIKTPLFWIVVAVAVVVIAIAVVALVVFGGMAVLAAIGAVLAVVGKVLLVIGVIAGVIAAGYYVYLMITKPHLSWRERGRLLGRAVFELALAFAGTGILARLKVLAQVRGVRALVARVGGLMTALRLITKVPSLEKIIVLLDKVGDAERLLKLLDHVSDADKLIVLIDRVGDIDRLLLLLEAFRDVDKLVAALDKVGDAGRLLLLLERVVDANKLIRLLEKVTDGEKLLALLDKVGDADKLLRLAEKVPDGEKLLRLVEKVPNADDLAKLLDEIVDGDRLLRLLDEMPPADLTALITKHGGESVRWATDGLPAADAQKLLDAMTPEILAAMRGSGVVAADAKRLVDAFGGVLLKQLADAGIAPKALLPVLAQQEPGQAAKIIQQYVDRAATKPATWDALRNFLAGAERAEAEEIARATAMGADEIMVDNNVLVAAQAVQGGVAWAEIKPHEQRRLIEAMTKLGHPPADPNVVTAAEVEAALPKMRASATVLGEIGAEATHKASTGTVEQLGRLERPTGVLLDVDRDSDAYRRVLTALDSPPARPWASSGPPSAAVGGAKGLRDRSVVADALFATTQGGGPAKFMTGDTAIFETLAGFEPTGSLRLAPGLKTGSNTFAARLARAYPNGFKIVIDGRELWVIPVGI